MPIRSMAIISLLLTVPAAFAGAPQDQTSKPTLEQQLNKEYPVTRVGTNGVVVQPGTILAVLEDGIKAIPATYQGYLANSVKKGVRVKTNLIQHIGGGGGTGFHPAYLDEARLFQVGEKVYLTKIEMNKDTEVVFSFQSCGACDPAIVDPNPPFRASVAFQFAKGYLTGADLKGVQETIGEVFQIANPPAALPPTATGVRPPAAEPATIAIGQTKEQVTGALGQPERIAKVANKEIYFYKDMKITFVDSKVSNVE